MNTRKFYLGLGGLLASAVAVFLLVSSSTNAASVDAVKKAASGVVAGDPAKGCPHGEMAGMESYVFTGTVKKVDLEKKRITLQHEKIGDYMEAMTMPFGVHDAALLNGLEAGMSRWFVLHVMENKSMIVAVADSKEAAEQAMSGAHHAVEAGEGHGSHGDSGHEGGACCSAGDKAKKAGGHSGCGGH